MKDGADTSTETTENVDTTETPATKETPSTKPDTKPEAKKDERVTTESLYDDKITRLHADLRKERDDLKATRKERDELLAKVNDFTVKEKKSDALSKALSELGEDFEVPSDKLPVLSKLIGKIADSETLAEDIAEAVTGFKSPKVKEQTILNTPFGGPAPAGQKSGKNMTDAEKMELARTNPDQFKKLYGKPVFGN